MTAHTAVVGAIVTRIWEAGEAHIVTVKSAKPVVTLTHQSCLPQVQEATSHLFALHLDGSALQVESTEGTSLVVLDSEHHLGPADDQGRWLQ